jgi:hypothetical protein
VRIWIALRETCCSLDWDPSNKMMVEREGIEPSTPAL